MTSIIDEELTLCAAESIDDWWLIERANHDGREWLEPTEYGASFMRSARISDADIEGTAGEMKAIASAIENRDSFTAKRCAVAITPGLAHFWSPRNSQKTATVPLKRAEDLATLIRYTLSGE